MNESGIRDDQNSVGISSSICKDGVSESRKERACTPIETTLKHKSSDSSVDSSILKCNPADPQVTELNGISSVTMPINNRTAISSVADIIENSDHDYRTSTFFNTMISSFSFKSESKKGPTGFKTDSDVNSLLPSSETIIHSKTSSSKEEKLSINLCTKSIDSSLQMNVKLKETDDDKGVCSVNILEGTKYKYASESRDKYFHNFFNLVPLSDRLVDDFSCALSREFLFQGRIYVTPNYICFYSNLLGWITNLVISMNDVISLEKTSTVRLFPNGISIETTSGRHDFVSFTSRDSTFEFLETIWRISQVKHQLTNGKNGSPTLSTSEDFFIRSYGDLVRIPISRPQSRSSMCENDLNIEKAILSVDDFIPTTDGTIECMKNGTHEEDDSDILSTDQESGEDCMIKNVYQFKENSNYEYDGPYYFQNTQFKYDPEENSEYLLAELELNSPPGMVYQILFSDDNSQFILDFLKSQNGSQISHIPPFDQVNKDGQHYREYTYTKALNYPVGPKSTKCNTTEMILHCDYENYINVVTTTKTPDVPSGGSFSVKTRYMLCWGSPITSILKVSFWVEWTGSSWIKSMVDKSCKTGQIEATSVLVDMIKNYVEKNVISTKMRIDNPPVRRQSQSRRTSRLSSKSSKVFSEKDTEITPESNKMNIPKIFDKESMILFLLCVISILMCVNLIYQIQITRHLSIMSRSKSEFNESHLDVFLDHFKNIFEIKLNIPNNVTDYFELSS